MSDSIPAWPKSGGKVTARMSLKTGTLQTTRRHDRPLLIVIKRQMPYYESVANGVFLHTLLHIRSCTINLFN